MSFCQRSGEKHFKCEKRAVIDGWEEQPLAHCHQSNTSTQTVVTDTRGVGDAGVHYQA